MGFGNGEDVIEKFNKLVQDKIMEEYVEKFKELKSLIKALDPTLLEAYNISSFFSGLKNDIRLMFKILKPTKLMQAVKQVKWQEE